MNETIGQIIEAIDDVLEGKPVLKWDYYVSVQHEDPILDSWVARLRELEMCYSDSAHGRMLTEEGLAELRQLRSEILQQQST